MVFSEIKMHPTFYTYSQNKKMETNLWIVQSHFLKNIFLTFIYVCFYTIRDFLYRHQENHPGKWEWELREL